MNKFTIRDSKGMVDVTASVAAYSQALTSWVAVNETPVEVISKAVNAVFDTHSQPLPKSFLVTSAVREIAPEPDQYQVVSNRVSDYIKGQVNSGEIDFLPGKGGGFQRSPR